MKEMTSGQSVKSSWMVLSTGGAMVVCFVCILGCGSSASDKVVGTVKVTVTYGGEPVTGCSVEMVVVGEGKGAAGDLDDSGVVNMSDVEVGNYTVTVRPPATLDPDPEKPLVTPKEYPNVPQKFRTEETSPLKADVKEGANEFQFDLKE